MFRTLLASALLGLSSLGSAAAADDLASEFARPPESARPWVYWFWLNSNITKLASPRISRRCTASGLAECSSWKWTRVRPWDRFDFMSDRWREMFRHAISEASRLGLEVNMNNDAGWNGSGGPWIRPEESMQEVVWTETEVTGAKVFEGVLPLPSSQGRFLPRHCRAGFAERREAGGLPTLKPRRRSRGRGQHKPPAGACRRRCVDPAQIRT